MKKKKIFSSISLLLMLFMATAVLASCWQAKVTEISINQESIKTEWFVGDELDFSDIEVTATYSDGKTKQVAYDELSISTISSETEGVKQLTVGYEEKTDTIQITINKVALVGIEFVEDSIKTDWFVGDQLDFSGLKIIANYSNSTTVELSYSELILSEVSSELAGKQNLVVTYQEKTATVELTISEVLLESITADVNSIETEWRIESTPDFSELKITAHYSNGTSKLIAYSQLELSTVSTQELGVQNLTVIYQGKTVYVPITIIEAEVVLVNISVQEGSVQTEWFVGDELDFSQIIVIAHFSNDTTTEHNFSSVTLSSISSAQAGVQSLKVSYRGKSVDVAITIKEVTVTAIEVNQESIQTEWFVGDELDFSSIAVNVTYSNGTNGVVTFQDLTLSNISSAEAGTQNLVVTHGEKQSVVEITINAVLPQSLTVKEGTYQSEWDLGDELNFETIQVVVVYNNGTTETKIFADLQLSDISSNEDGVKVLTVSFGSVSNTVNITIIENEMETFEAPDFVTQFRSNIQVKANKEVEYSVKDDFYYVGSQNDFVFLPKMQAFVEDDFVEVKRYMSVVEVYLNDNGVYTLLEGTNLTSLVAVDNINSSFKFTKEAEGKVFKISVQPKNFTNHNAIDFEFKVTDGWNAYTAADLSRIDNVNKTNLGHLNGKGVWTDYKAANNIDNTEINGIILHADIKITANDIPLGYTYQAGDSDLPLEAGNGDPYNIIGSLRDNSSLIVIYDRSVPSDQTWSWIGNYFTVDAKELPKVVYNYFDKIFTTDGVEGAGVGSASTHSRIFGLGGNHSTTGGNQGNVVVKNLTLIGNSNRTESFLDAGGITLILSHANDFLMDNVNIRGAYTAFIPVGEYLKGESLPYNLFTIKNSKGYDSFSSMFLLWGAKLVIIDSEFKNAGGPLFVQMHVNSSANSVKAAHLELINTVVENFVSGDEAYFIINEQTELVTSIKPLLSGLDQYSTYLGLEKRVSTSRAGIEVFNLISVVLFDDEGAYTSAIGGTSKINMNDVNISGFDFNNPNVATLIAQTGGLAPIIQSSGGGLGYYTGAAAPFNSSAHAPLGPDFFVGENMNLYYGNTGIILNFIN